tara:strand:- start:329 stop:2251 length:1923 start_codon:yes stop_codon:yes gene_type:complete
MPEVDPNAIIASVASDLIKQTLKSVFSEIPSSVKSKFTQYFENFENSMERMAKTCTKVRTIINKDHPVELLDIYVKSRYICAENQYSDDSIIQFVRDGQRVIVSGFGGIGKTVFCKYMWISLFKNPMGKVPIYFELRHLNELSKVDLISYIRISLASGDGYIPEDVFLKMLQAGRFIFILDAFDEVPDKIRAEVQKQILDLSSRFDECGFVVSSRADDRFASWHDFHQYHVQKFDKDQSREVIENIEFDKDIKKEFLSEILEKNYEDYKEFFGTPLLTLLMLMTYIQIKHIPESPHIFYRYAFQTLYTLHDASKQGFQRKRHVSMTEAQFINVFSLFCLVSYIDGDHSFSREQVVNILDNVKIRADVEYDSEEFLRECIESVNLIYKEGEVYSFTHRSFQEYFSAYAVSHYFMENYREIIYKIPIRRGDTVLSMVNQINKSLFDQLFVAPEYEKIRHSIDGALKKRKWLDVLAELDYTTTLIYGKNSKRYSLAGIASGYKHEISRFASVILQASLNAMSYHWVDAFEIEGRDRPRTREIFARLKPGEKSAVLVELKFADYHAGFALREDVDEIFGMYGVDEFEPDFKVDKDKFILVATELECEKVAVELKAELVYVKKYCDEILRKSKLIRGSGLDILSM